MTGRKARMLVEVVSTNTCTNKLGEWADWITLSGHKLGGPDGIGVLIGSTEEMQPLNFGGDQQKGRRPGSLPTLLVGAFGLACEMLYQERTQRLHHQRLLTLRFHGFLCLWRRVHMGGRQPARTRPASLPDLKRSHPHYLCGYDSRFCGLVDLRGAGRLRSPSL